MKCANCGREILDTADSYVENNIIYCLYCSATEVNYSNTSTEGKE